MGAALTFLPPFHSLRELGGLPEAGNPFYTLVLAIWIFFFGIFYLRLAFSKTPERYFVFIGALGKSSFAILLMVLAFSGELPMRAAFTGVGDLMIAKIFFVWLCQTREKSLTDKLQVTTPNMRYADEKQIRQ